MPVWLYWHKQNYCPAPVGLPGMGRIRAQADKKTKPVSNNTMDTFDHDYKQLHPEADLRRRGSTEYQTKTALAARWTLKFITDNPGCTRVDMAAGLGVPRFNLLMKHKLAYWIKPFVDHPAMWFAINFPRDEALKIVTTKVEAWCQATGGGERRESGE
jgi:hypothetical protein